MDVRVIPAELKFIAGEWNGYNHSSLISSEILGSTPRPATILI